MKFFERVTVALCLDAVDADVLRYARLLRRLSATPMQFSFVHVLPPVDVWNAKGSPPQSLTEVRATMQAAVAQDFGDVDPGDLDVLTGSPLDKLLEAAADSWSDLLMLGHRSNARGRRSSGRRLAMKAPCSVCLVPQGAPAEITRVMAAVDFSQPSANAASLATLIANRAGDVPCDVLHVLEPNLLGYDTLEMKDAKRAFESFLAPLDLHGIELATVVVESGSVAASVRNHVNASGADLVVVGTRGRSRSAAVLLGSESEQILVESAVPVIVTKDRGDRIGILRTLLDRDFRSAEPQFG